MSEIIEKDQDDNQELNDDVSNQEPETNDLEDQDDNVSLWGDDAGQTDDLSSQVPVGKHVRIKNELKGKLSEREQEIERLRQENETLKTSGSAPQTKKSLSLPKLENYETDDEYNQALASYIDNKIQSESLKQQQQMTEEGQKAQIQKQRAIEVNSHYARASEFVKSVKIKPDLYNQADKVVRDAIDLVNPGKGDLITDQIISVLGDGSEKVMYYLGVNSTARNRLHSLLLEDSTGMKAIAYLGGVKNKISNPKKIKTNAPEPSQPIQEDAVSDKSVKVDKRSYQKAEESGNMQKVFDIRRAARSKGIDISDW
jgi:hypothetical protein